MYLCGGPIEVLSHLEDTPTTVALYWPTLNTGSPTLLYPYPDHNLWRTPETEHMIPEPEFSSLSRVEATEIRQLKALSPEPE